jgi:hypothetical protein
MLDKKTINELRKKRRSGATYPELSKSYGLAISSIEYWVGDIKPAKFTYFGRSGPASKGGQFEPSPLSKEKVGKWDENLSYLVEFASHQGDDSAEIKRKLDELLDANQKASSDNGHDNAVERPTAQTDVACRPTSTAAASIWPTSYATMSNDQRRLYLLAGMALMRNDYETANRAAMLYYLGPPFS